MIPIQISPNTTSLSIEYNNDILIHHFKVIFFFMKTGATASLSTLSATVLEYSTYSMK